MKTLFFLATLTTVAAVYKPKNIGQLKAAVNALYTSGQYCRITATEDCTGADYNPTGADHYTTTSTGDRDSGGGTLTLLGHIKDWDISDVGNSLQNLFSSKIWFNQDISGWDMTKIKSTRSMFEGAHSFNQDLSAWNTPLLLHTDKMFRSACSFNSPVWNWDPMCQDLDQGATVNYMFADSISHQTTAPSNKCYSMFGYGQSPVNEMQFNQHLDSFDFRFKNTDNLCNGADTRGGLTYINFMQGARNFGRDGKKKIFKWHGQRTLYNNFEEGNYYRSMGLFKHSADFADTAGTGFNTGWSPRSMDYAAPGEYQFPNVDFSPWELGTGEVHKSFSMNGIFGYYRGELPDLSLWDTSKVKHWDGAFQGFNAHITQADRDNIAALDTSSAETMVWAFRDCQLDLDISQWDVSKVKDMWEIFSKDSGIMSDLSGWDTSSVNIQRSAGGGTVATPNNCAKLDLKTGEGVAACLGDRDDSADGWTDSKIGLNSRKKARIDDLKLKMPYATNSGHGCCKQLCVDDPTPTDGWKAETCAGQSPVMTVLTTQKYGTTAAACCLPAWASRCGSGTKVEVSAGVCAGDLSSYVDASDSDALRDAWRALNTC